MSLNTKQIQALDSIKEGRNTFITGSAGVGKSFLINKIQEQLHDKYYEIIAPTGIAAINVSGQTIHRFFGLKIETKTIHDYFKYCMKYSKINWSRLELLIVDEVSMWNADIFSLCDEICQFHKNNNKPFGGIQIVLVGDFYQLCPIQKNTIESSIELFIFETETWNKLNLKVVVLEEIMRQTDVEFINHLNNIRVGNVTEDTRNFIESLTRKIPNVNYVQIYSKNFDKARANMKNLNKIKSESKSFSSTDTGEERHLSSLLAEKVIVLKKGAPVMLLKNLNDTLCNGSLGTIVDFNAVGLPIVLFNNGITMTMEPQKWEIKKRNEYGNFSIIASRTQIPLTIAYAISVHKSQGMSIDYVEADSKDVFANGQFYVMLSRAKTKEGLLVKNFKMEYIMVDERVRHFYNELNGIN